MKNRKIQIFPLLKTHHGFCPGESAVATVSLAGEKTVIHCHDGALKEKIHQIFNTPLKVRRVEGQIPRIFSHRYEEIQPHTEEFFREILYAIKRYNLFGSPVSRAGEEDHLSDGS